MPMFAAQTPVSFDVFSRIVLVAWIALAGCQVERIAGANEAETRRLLEQLAAQNKRFRTLR